MDNKFKQLIDSYDHMGKTHISHTLSYVKDNHRIIFINPKKINEDDNNQIISEEM